MKRAPVVVGILLTLLVDQAAFAHVTICAAAIAPGDGRALHGSCSHRTQRLDGIARTRKYLVA